jgi:hypothetical protein
MRGIILALLQIAQGVLTFRFLLHKKTLTPTTPSDIINP